MHAKLVVLQHQSCLKCFAQLVSRVPWRATPCTRTSWSDCASFTAADGLSESPCIVTFVLEVEVVEPKVTALAHCEGIR